MLHFKIRTQLGGVLMLLTLSNVAACQKAPEQTQSLFEAVPVRTELSPQTILETSGIADSRINQGYLWVHEDSGNPPRIFLTAHDGKVVKSVYIANVINRDWEDMTLSKGPDPALDYIYLGDFGDNGATHNEYIIYRFPEPSLTVDTVRNVAKIRFRFPDGSHDTEAMIVDQLNNDIYLVTKRDKASMIYRIKNNYSVSEVNEAEYVTSLPYNGVVSAAIAPDRSGLLIKTYSVINLYKIARDQSIESVFDSMPVPLNYEVEPQGEAISFAIDNSGFFTLSEKGFARTVRLYFYKKK